MAVSDTDGGEAGGPPADDAPPSDHAPAPPAERVPFESLALDQLDALYRTALRLTRSPQDAEDLVQETLVRAYRFYDRFTPGTNFRAWLFRILNNTHLNMYRRKRARPQESSLDEADDFFLFHHLGASDGGHAPEAQADVAAEVLDRLGTDDIQRAIDRLPAPYRAAVQLADVEGLSYAEIAEATGVARGTVMSRLFRGRRLLQRALWDAAEAAGYTLGSKVNGASARARHARARP